MTTAIASSGGRCHSVVLTERYARPPRVARTHHRRSHSKLSETQFREGFSAPRYPPNVPPPPPHLGPLAGTWVPPPHPTLDLGRQRRWGGGDYEGPPWGGTLARYLPEVPPSPFKWPLLLVGPSESTPTDTQCVRCSQLAVRRRCAPLSARHLGQVVQVSRIRDPV
jgi:hypothetical protein